MVLPVVGWLGVNLAESFVDRVLRDMVREPAVGGVVYCDLAFGMAEHSGIYMGQGQIAHLNRHGEIEVVDPEEFIDGTTAMSIYTACCGTRPVGDAKAAANARYFLQHVRRMEYSLLLQNCHIFSAACYNGDLNNSDSFLWMLKDTAKAYLGADSWRVWDF